MAEQMNIDGFRTILLEQTDSAQLWIAGSDEEGYTYTVRYQDLQDDRHGCTFVSWHGAVTEAREWFAMLRKEGLA